MLVAALAAGWVIAGPLRGGRAEAEDAALAARLEDLEAAKEARYREIREAEMDFRTGKLSEGDYKAIDRQLRQRQWSCCVSWMRWAARPSSL